jgi:hypothetical protein
MRRKLTPNVTAVLCAIAAVATAVTQPEFDCPARNLAMAQAVALLGRSPLADTLSAVADGLQLKQCEGWVQPPLPAAEKAASPHPSNAVFVVALNGSDTVRWPFAFFFGGFFGLHMGAEAASRSVAGSGAVLCFH